MLAVDLLHLRVVGSSTSRTGVRRILRPPNAAFMPGTWAIHSVIRRGRKVRDLAGSRLPSASSWCVSSNADGPLIQVLQLLAGELLGDADLRRAAPRRRPVRLGGTDHRDHLPHAGLRDPTWPLAGRAAPNLTNR
jgi:hypothetical protein